MKKIVNLIEEINKLSEQDVNEITLQDEIEPEKPAQIIEPEKEEPFVTDTMSLADQFDAKARIARALDALKDAVEEFKNATVEKVDLLKDQALLSGIDRLDNQVQALEQALATGSNILGNTELNDPFKAQLPAQDTEKEDDSNTLEEEPEVQDTTEPDEEEEEIYDFDAQAGLDLITDED